MVYLKHIQNSEDSTFEKLSKLYQSAFPSSERRSIEELKETIEKSAYMHFYAVYDDEKIAGFSIYWDFGEFIYLEHFAIFPEMRNLGIGRQVLHIIAQKTNKIRILEVEPNQDDLTARRILFYQRNGYSLASKNYNQPHYGKQGIGIPLWIMSSETIDKEKLENYIAIIKRQVYFAFYKDKPYKK